MNKNALEIESLTYCYGRLDALRGLDLTVQRGSIYAFIGPNGAGKSTTLSICVNTLQPSGGQVSVLGTESVCLQAKDFSRIGYVAEPQEMPGWMTGQQMIDFLKPLYPKWDEDFRKKLQRTLDVPLIRKIKNMSRGEQMKLRLLVSMAYHPELLILDEPFSGLDPLVREELSAGLLELVGGSDWTVLLASHDVDELERLVDYAGFIAQGRMRFSESVESLQGRYHQVSARFRAKPALHALPKAWYGVESDDKLLRYVDSAYDATACRSALERLGELELVESRALSLREIFVAETRSLKSRRGIIA